MFLLIFLSIAFVLVCEKMKKNNANIISVGWIEILTLLIPIVTVVHRDEYPLILNLLPIPVAILGFCTIKLKLFARRWNILLSPVIVLTYTFGFMVIFDAVLAIINLSFELNQYHLGILFAAFLFMHIFFFTRPNIKEQFNK